jgi:hypothetical protein
VVEAVSAVGASPMPIGRARSVSSTPITGVTHFSGADHPTNLWSSCPNLWGFSG